MILIRSLQALYAATIDRSKFREVASRWIVFILPLFYWGRTPVWWGMGIAALGLAIRAWAAGHLHKDKVMAHSGPYLVARHPLYLGSCLLALGLIISINHWVTTLVIGGITFMTYMHTIRHEEQNLLSRFGSQYAEYCKLVGPLWPTRASLNMLMNSKSRDEVDTPRFSLQQYLKNREYECLLGVVVVFFALYLGTL